MESSLVMWLIAFALAVVYVVFKWLIKPDKCPKCGTNMKWESYTKDGKEVDSQYCPNCDYEEILNEE